MGTESTCDTTTDKKFLKYFRFLEINYENIMANSKLPTDQQAALISISSQETMDLIGVNNSIVNMRKNSMRARIHVIRDLLKKIKELQQKKSKTDAQKAQNERKTSRLQSELTIIKQLKKDEMSRFALTNTKKQG